MKQQYLLNAGDISVAIDRTSLELERAGIEDRPRLAFRLAMEEILLLYREKLGEDAPWSLSCRKWSGDLVVRLNLDGEALDPFARSDAILNKLYRRFRTDPEWRYKGNCNQVIFTFRLYNTTRKNIRFSWKYTVESRKTLAFSVVFQFISAVLGGVNLSGGQRQHLAIARSMLRGSRIILFDEATSALDNATQARIQQAIDNMRQGRTVVIIAHRISTIVNADRILFMQEGRILTEGTHEQLLAECEPYRQLAAMDMAQAE